jgi:hypothetical protein
MPVPNPERHIARLLRELSGRSPQRVWVKPAGISADHHVVDLAGRFRVLQDGVEDADVLPGLLNVAWVITIAGALVTGDDRPRAEGIDLVQGADPFLPCLRTRFPKLKENVVVDGW